MRPYSTKIKIAAIFVISLSLRLTGIGFGLPMVSNFYVRPDETLIAVPSISMLENWGNPHFFTYPALMMELSALFYQIRFLLLKVFGATQAASISLDFGAHMSGYILVSRALSAIFSACTVLVVYKIGRRVCKGEIPLLAAALLAVSPLACRDAHFGVTDSLVTLCGAACVYLLTVYLETGRGKDLCLASIFLGLALSSKYSAATIYPLLFIAVLINNKLLTRTDRIKGAAIAAVVPIALFLLLNPFVIPEFQSFRQAVASIVGTLYYNNQPNLPLATVLKQALIPLKYGPGGLLCLPLMFAALLSRTSDRETRGARLLLGAAFILSFLPAISFKHQIPYRYVLPALPFASILMALGIEGIADRFNRYLGRIVFAGFVLVALVPALISTVWMDILLRRTDTRTLAGQWIAASVPLEIPIVLAGWPECEPQLPETTASILRRIDFVRRFYGESAVPVVAAPYHLQLHSGVGGKRTGYEVYRTAAPAEIPGNLICLVVPTYPDSFCAVRSADIPTVVARFPGRVTAVTEIKSLRQESAGHVLDPIDAFFLPMDMLANIVRPGPCFHIYMISLNSRIKV
jgi:4-amino-4-deoxy-L-arabinose transferase-like glycosyltransferase